MSRLHFFWIERYWAPLTFLLGLAIIFLSLWPLETLPDVPGSDKTHHFIAYFSLMFPIALVKRRKVIYYYLFFLTLSGVIELLQPLVNRYCDWKDLVANGLGLLLGLVVGRLLALTPLFKPNGKSH